MKLSILSIDKKIDHEVLWVEINTPDGNFIIQDNHIETIFSLSPQKEITFKLLSSEEIESFFIHGFSVLEVTNKNEAVLLLGDKCQES